MRQHFAHNRVFERATEFGIVVSVIGIAQRSYSAIAQAGEEQVAILPGPFDDVGAEALNRPLNSGEVDCRGDAGNFASREEHGWTKVVE